MKKLIISVLVLTAVLLFAFGAGAEELPADAVTETAAEESAAAAPGQTENVFETMYRAFVSHAAELLAGASAVLSAGLVLFVRRGMIPMLKSGLNALGTAAAKIKEDGTGSADSVAKTAESVNNYLQILTKTVENVLSSLENLASRLEELPQITAEQGDVRTLLLSEVDMLNEIFMSSSLPEYKKELVGQKVAAMREALSARQNG